MNEQKRITKEDLVLYVPIFLQGEQAAAMLLEHGAKMSRNESLHCQTMVLRRELAVQKIADLSMPLISKEIHKLIATSHLRNREDLFDILYVAALDGLRRGLRKFEMDKMNVSTTNYLFQWITTYARKELNTLEAPFGIPPSRFLVYKKISAVRKKLSAELQRDATNDEILEYFHDGRADLDTMNGRLANKGKPSQANKNITLELVVEQQRFEQEMMTIELVDPTDGYGQSQISTTVSNTELFSETFFGVFLESYPFTPEAKAVLMSELQRSDGMNEEEQEILMNLTKRRYSAVEKKWKRLMMDANGPFGDFLRKNKDSDFEQFDVVGTLRILENSGAEIAPKEYGELLVRGTK